MLLGKQYMKDFCMTKALPKEITSYDLLKALAIILMVVDHIGHFFFFDELWFRVIGRFSAPFWFFLIGYANSRDLGARLWIGAAILIVTGIVTGHNILPLNILVTIIVCRLVLDRVMAVAVRSYENLGALVMLMALLILPTAILAEYGTLGFLFVMFGWFMRHREELTYPVKGVPETFILILILIYVYTQSLTYGMSETQTGFLALGTAAVCLVLYRFRPLVFPAATAAMPCLMVWFIHLMGRRTLEIYVIHLVLFKLTALLSGDPRFGWFDIGIFESDKTLAKVLD